MASLTITAPASADPSDISAAARGVVRVVIVDGANGEVIPVSHGSGFAVTPKRIVTNAHVVEEVVTNPDLRIGIVPSEGGDAAYAKIISISRRNDLALVEITGNLRLPVLTLGGAASPESGEVSAVGYPMNVDQAQGLQIADIFKSQPPVKSRGSLSGNRPSRQFDTILHTAPIARGNSGGPLLDSCGRVLGVNSFGADSNGGDAEFFFAVSMRELLPFLRANDVTPRVNGMPCRSLADLDAAERAAANRKQMSAAAATERAEAANRQARAKARESAQFEIMEERENAMALAAMFLVIALVAGFVAYQAKQAGNERRTMIAGSIAGVAMIAAIAMWFTRPGMSELDDRTAAKLAETNGETSNPDEPPSTAGVGKLLCTIDVTRSRITGAQTDDLPLEWAEDGCVNGRTQYGLSSGKWNRVFVPNEEAVVSVNSYDANTAEYRVERYLLGRAEITEARKERGDYKAPQCGGGEETAQDLGSKQETILALLPDRPNERLVYNCQVEGE
ncbi:serine protease [Altererythrobacter sp. ZODW24]|uniref:S1C family serine protease n=1 Tax=Altererythrobacter sp. ZODW24 TaxID=2185142 RepID=UPI001F071B9F|nr:serine protease [Altererythrobacter sp. ZODW24]